VSCLEDDVALVTWINRDAPRRVDLPRRARRPSPEGLRAPMTSEPSSPRARGPRCLDDPRRPSREVLTRFSTRNQDPRRLCRGVFLSGVHQALSPSLSSGGAFAGARTRAGGPRAATCRRGRLPPRSAATPCLLAGLLGLRDSPAAVGGAASTRRWASRSPAPGKHGSSARPCRRRILTSG